MKSFIFRNATHQLSLKNVFIFTLSNKVSGHGKNMPIIATKL